MRKLKNIIPILQYDGVMYIEIYKNDIFYQVKENKNLTLWCSINCSKNKLFLKKYLNKELSLYELFNKLPHKYWISKNNHIIKYNINYTLTDSVPYKTSYLP